MWAKSVFAWLCLIGLMGGGSHCHVVQKDPSSAPFELNIIHVNDIHAHFEEMNAYGSRCNDEQSKENQCYGGQARLLTKARELKSKSPNNTLFLNAGDYYTGSAMFSAYGYPVIVDFSNMMGYDAMSIGNHDFDKQISGLVPYLKEANYDFLAANLDRSSIPGMEKCKNSVIKEINGHKIGIIGYIYSRTPTISSSNLTSLQFLPEVAAIQKEAKMLKADHNVDIIIALGHSGYKVDKQIARMVPEVDVVVGGHSHTFLWTGDNPPSHEKPRGPYPTYIKQDSGKVVPVVQVYCYSKYIGYFRLKFDAKGELLTPVDGVGVTEATPYLIDRSIEPDQDVEERIKYYRKNMTEYNEVVGNTTVFLHQYRDNEEGNLGDLVAEANLDLYGEDADISLVNDGGIRASIATGDIIEEDVINVMPFQNTVDKGEVRGDDLRLILEEAYSQLTEDHSVPTFYQMAGLRVKVKVTPHNAMKRIVDMKVKCNATSGGSYEWCDFVDWKFYTVVLPSFVAGGGDAIHTGFDQVMRNYTVGTTTDTDALKLYIKKHSPINTQVDGRITIDFEETSSSNQLTASSATYCIVLMTFVIAILNSLQ